MQNNIKCTYARIVPTVIVLVMSFLLFGIILGYTFGSNYGPPRHLNPEQKCPNIPLLIPKNFLPSAPPVDSSGYINI